MQLWVSVMLHCPGYQYLLHHENCVVALLCNAVQYYSFERYSCGHCVCVCVGGWVFNVLVLSVCALRICFDFVSGEQIIARALDTKQKTCD